VYLEQYRNQSNENYYPYSTTNPQRVEITANHSSIMSFVSWFRVAGLRELPRTYVRKSSASFS